MMLFMYVSNTHKNWNGNLHKTECAITSPHEISKLTPHFIDFGRTSCETMNTNMMMSLFNSTMVVDIYSSHKYLQMIKND